MASQHSSTENTAATINSPPIAVTTQPPPSPITSPLVALNANTQLPVRLTSTNYHLWQTSVLSLLIGYDLDKYVNGSFPCPAAILIHEDGSSSANPLHLHWIRQDKLIYHGLLASLSENLLSHIASCPTSAAAWTKLSTLFASRSRSRLMHLKSQLSALTCDSLTMAAYLQKKESLADEIALIDTPVRDDDLVIYTLNGLTSDFNTISTNLRNREPPITFAELHDKLIEQETLLQKSESLHQPSLAVAHYAGRPSRPNWSSRGRAGTSSRPYRSRQPSRHTPASPPLLATPRPSPAPHQNFDRSFTAAPCQICDRRGHFAKQCPSRYATPPSRAKSAHTATSTSQSSPWLLDSGASDHLTNALGNLSFYSDYDGTEEIQVGNGMSLAISHIGSRSVDTAACPLELSDVLCFLP